jgi:hypothetical protein
MKKACFNAGLLALMGNNNRHYSIQLQIDKRKFSLFFCVNYH